MPITNDAGIAQVSPGASAIDLTQPAQGYPDSPEVYQPSGEFSFARVVPSDGEQVRALAQWASELDVTTLLLSEGQGPFEKLMASQFASEASAAGVETRTGVVTVSKGRPEPAPSFYPGLGGTGPGKLSVDGVEHVVSGEIEPKQLPLGSFPSDFRQRIGRRPGPYAAYGFEAMRVTLEAIAAADRQDGFRASVADELLGSEHPTTILGSYSITPAGDTTLCAVQRYTLRRTLVPSEVVCPSG